VTNDTMNPSAPSKLVPVLAGGATMTASVLIPVLNLVNCLCCAGVMGGAVLGVWMYKRTFPPDLPFRVSDGAAVGALAGIVGAVLNTLISGFELMLASGGIAQRIEAQFETMQNSPISGADPAQLEQAREFVTQLAQSPGLLVILVFVLFLVIFTGFGALGGVIGGNIFKTKTAPPAPTA
jgi:hypothetical protein